MKKEDFASLIGDIDDSYIANARKPAKTVKYIKYSALAACMCVLLIVAVPLTLPRGMNNSSPKAESMELAMDSSITAGADAGPLNDGLYLNGKSADMPVEFIEVNGEIYQRQDTVYVDIKLDELEMVEENIYRFEDGLILDDDGTLWKYKLK